MAPLNFINVLRVRSFSCHVYVLGGSKNYYRRDEILLPSDSIEVALSSFLSREFIRDIPFRMM